jgi:cyanate permease
VIFGTFTLIMTVSSSISTPVMGAVFDISGSYRPVWVVFLAFSIVISICLIVVEMRWKN